MLAGCFWSRGANPLAPNKALDDDSSSASQGLRGTSRRALEYHVTAFRWVVVLGLATP